MKKWAIAAILYLAVVISAYGVYSQIVDKNENDNITNNNNPVHSTEHEGEGNHTAKEESNSHDHTETDGHDDNEVVSTVVYEGGTIKLTLEDLSGNPVTELKVNHEKLLHLIIVDEHLEQYYHLHPTTVEAGKFEVEQELPDGNYKAFIDIKPKNLSYEVQPLVFKVGDVEETHAHEGILTPDSELVKTVDGKTVALQIQPMEKAQPVTLTFDIDPSKLEPYLGAAGHVVILDEQAETYLHVHPADEKRPIFETTFNKAGIYKIWAEFKQNGIVTVYPYVVEIK